MSIMGERVTSGMVLEQNLRTYILIHMRQRKGELEMTWVFPQAQRHTSSNKTTPPNPSPIVQLTEYKYSKI